MLCACPPCAESSLDSLASLRSLQAELPSSSPGDGADFGSDKRRFFNGGEGGTFVEPCVELKTSVDVSATDFLLQRFVTDRLQPAAAPLLVPSLPHFQCNPPQLLITAVRPFVFIAESM